MSVLIKGMVMPEDCFSCPLKEEGYCNLTNAYAGLINERNSDCPLVEVPEKHGRLIDADELIDDLKHDIAIYLDMLDYEELSELNRINIQGDKDIKQNAIGLLKRSKTVIEAEGEE